MIYIDSDGIGADWLGYVTEHHITGVTQKELNNLEDLDQRLMEMYRKDPNLFYNLKAVPGFKEIFRFIIRLGDYRILTVGAPKHHVCRDTVANDKKRWWREKFGVPEGKVIVLDKAKYKSMYARSKTDILFDDRLDTVEDFFSAGGRGLHIPTAKEYDKDLTIAIKQSLLKLSTLNPKENGYISLK